MQRKEQKLIAAFTMFGFLALLGALAPQARAQEARRSVIISPPTVHATVNPGENREGTITLTNSGNTELNFTTTIRDFTVEDTRGTPNFLGVNQIANKYSAASWIGVDEMNFSVKSRQQQTINYYITIPQDARPGGHYASILFSPVVSSNIQGSGAQIHSQVGVLFYITVNGTISEQAQITKFSANTFQEYGPVTLAAQIKNLGDLHITPVGTITLTDVFGRKVETINFRQYNIFPGASRDYTAVIGSQFMIGPVTSTLFAHYGRNNNLVLSARTTTWVFPWKIGILVLLCLIAMILAIIYWRKIAEETAKKKSDEPTQPITETKN